MLDSGQNRTERVYTSFFVVLLIHALIFTPVAAAIALYCLRSESWRKAIVMPVAAAVCVGVLGLLWEPVFAGSGESDGTHFVTSGLAWLELGLALFVTYIGLKARRPLIVILILVQSGIMAIFEWTHGHQLEAARPLVIDQVSVIMALINGVVGGGICLYAIGYMREFHEKAHPEVPDRRAHFFALLFLFMGSMFGIVFSNSLLWLYCFWELTTICSFLLIGYTKTEEARRNALRALTMNLAGGLAFAIAIVWAYRQTGVIELDKLVASRKTLVLFPAALLCFAGITKSAQLPFSSWLLGAMVAPTPVSALLHSSTMVKAGVYLVLRMAPIITGTRAGLVVALVGGLTFLVGSLAAITTSDAKKVLAHSTIANLGLIVLCGGIGTASAVWAGVLLIVFHAVAKCLLFLCVGVVEQKLRSRDIERMSGLILNLPRVAVMMLIGMAGMFLAPFGMLISKWAVLKAVVDAYPALSVFIIFGSAATLFFWVKWMGKLLEVVRPSESAATALALGQSVALYGLSAGTLMACLLFPLISTRLIEPYVTNVYGQSITMSAGNITIMTIMMVMVLLFPLSFINYGRGVRVTDAYLGGVNLKSSTRFAGSGDTAQEVSLKNYYLHGWLNETQLSTWGSTASSALLVLMLLLAQPSFL